MAAAFDRRSKDDWSAVYAEIADAFGLRLRPALGLDLRDVPIYDSAPAVSSTSLDVQ